MESVRLKDLEKPRVDWILEDGSYTVFGDTWFVRIAMFSGNRSVDGRHMHLGEGSHTVSR